MASTLLRCARAASPSHVLDFPSRGEADKHSLTLLGRHGDADSLTLERELADGEVLSAVLLKR